MPRPPKHRANPYLSSISNPSAMPDPAMLDPSMLGQGMPTQGPPGPYRPVPGPPGRATPGLGMLGPGPPSQSMPISGMLSMPGYPIPPYGPPPYPAMQLPGWQAYTQTNPSPWGSSNWPSSDPGHPKPSGHPHEDSYMGQTGPAATYWREYNERIKRMSDPNYDAELEDRINSDPTHPLNTYVPGTQPTFGPNGRRMVRIGNGTFMEAPSHVERRKDAQEWAKQSVLTAEQIEQYEQAARQIRHGGGNPYSAYGRRWKAPRTWMILRDGAGSESDGFCETGRSQCRFSMFSRDIRCISLLKEVRSREAAAVTRLGW